VRRFSQAGETSVSCERGTALGSQMIVSGQGLQVAGTWGTRSPRFQCRSARGPGVWPEPVSAAIAAAWAAPDCKTMQVAEGARDCVRPHRLRPDHLQVAIVCRGTGILCQRSRR
jgi:hypothetical protein